MLLLRTVEIFLLQSDCPEITKVHNKFKNNNKNGNFAFKCRDDQLVSVLFPVNVFRPKFAAAGLRQICERRATCEFFFKFGFIFAACWIRT